MKTEWYLNCLTEAFREAWSNIGRTAGILTDFLSASQPFLCPHSRQYFLLTNLHLLPTNAMSKSFLAAHGTLGPQRTASKRLSCEISISFLKAKWAMLKSFCLYVGSELAVTMFGA